MFKKIIGPATVVALVVLMLMIVLFYDQVEGQTTEGWTDEFGNTFPMNVSGARWIEAYIDEADSAWHTFSPKIMGQTILEWPAEYMPVRNKEGDTLKVGDACVFDTTRIAIADTVKAKPARIENDLTDEGGYHWIYVVADGTASDDSLWLWGLDEDGTAQAEVLVINDGAASYTKSAYMWTQIDSIKDDQSAQGWDSYDVCGLSFMGVRASDGVDYAFAGIMVGSGWTPTGLSLTYTLDNAVGFICVKGVCQGTIDGNSTNVWPGDQLTTAASGDLAPAAKQDSSYAGYPRITALELIDADNTKGMVLVK